MSVPPQQRLRRRCHPQTCGSESTYGGAGTYRYASASMPVLHHGVIVLCGVPYDILDKGTITTSAFRTIAQTTYNAPHLQHAPCCKWSALYSCRESCRP